MGTNVGAQAKGIVGRMERGNPDLAEAARVKAAWNRIADSRVRPHVTGVFVVPNTGASELVVYTDTPLWASELNMQMELMRVKLNMELARMSGPEGGPADPVGEGQVKRLRFVASKRQYASRELRLSTYEQLRGDDAETEAVDPVPLEPAQEAQLRSAAAKIADGKLREAALGAARASLEWQRGLAAAEKGTGVISAAARVI